MVEAHYRACLYAGVKIAGTNAEVMPAQVRACLVLACPQSLQEISDKNSGDLMESNRRVINHLLTK